MLPAGLYHVLAFKASLRRNFEGATVPGVCARLKAHVQDATQKVSELRRWILRDEVEFLNGVGAGRVGDFVVVVLIIVDAIENVVAGLFAIAVDIRTPDLEGILA